MSDVFRIALFVHVLFAVGSAVSFWIPVFTKKGSPRHVRFGRIYYRLVLLATATAILVSAIRFAEGVESTGEGLLADAFADDPRQGPFFVLFLIYIAIATATTALFGVRSIRRGTPRPLDVRLHQVVALFSILTVVSGAWVALLPMVAVGAAGLVLAVYEARSAARPVSNTGDRTKAHLTGMITSGIGVHSALAVVVAQRMSPEFFVGPFGIVAWLTPTLIGVPFLWICWKRVPESSSD